MSGREGSEDPADGRRERDAATRLARAARVLGTRRFRQLRRRAGEVRGRASDPVAPAFGRAVPGGQVADLFRYPRKRVVTTYALWLVAGYMGAHRFYLDREGTAVAQFLTGGGFLLWWLVDAFRLPSMVQAYNRDQAQREEAGRPPRALDFLETEEASDAPAGEAGRDDPDAPGSSSEAAPSWVEERNHGRVRLAADLAVVSFAGLMLGAVSGEAGAWRAAAAVSTVVVAVGFAPELAALGHFPGVRDLLRWVARLRLFYLYHDPGGPLSRLARPVVGIAVAPFRRRARAETHLYAELGGAFAILFFVIDLLALGVSLLTGEGELTELPGRWTAAALLTLVNVYAFASPIGATLYEHVLAGRSHRRVWLLGACALAALAAGTVAGLAAG